MNDEGLADVDPLTPLFTQTSPRKSRPNSCAAIRASQASRVADAKKDWLAYHWPARERGTDGAGEVRTGASRRGPASRQRLGVRAIHWSLVPPVRAGRIGGGRQKVVGLLMADSSDIG